MNINIFEELILQCFFFNSHITFPLFCFSKNNMANKVSYVLFVKDYSVILLTIFKNYACGVGLPHLESKNLLNFGQGQSRCSN